ncbi:Hypothetical_protein [Hexamita inflata]|uniref:Hypothetical_protein n=1 Tax=Hexamita inflata TaxID=28002 RepID=A0ABP1HPU8_9EUKA
MKSTAQLGQMTTILKTLQIILMSNSLQIYNNQSQVRINSLARVQVTSDIIVITPICCTQSSVKIENLPQPNPYKYKGQQQTEIGYFSFYIPFRTNFLQFGFQETL